MTAGLPEGHVAMVIAQCWLPDQELEVAGELGGSSVAVGRQEHTLFPLGKGHHATAGPGHLVAQAIESTSQGPEAKKERGGGY